MTCPLLIPFVITFDNSAEVTAESKVSPRERKETVKSTTVKRYIVRHITNCVHFYNVAIVKFCFHAVTIYTHHHFKTTQWILLWIILLLISKQIYFLSQRWPANFIRRFRDVGILNFEHSVALIVSCYCSLSLLPIVCIQCTT